MGPHIAHLGALKSNVGVIPLHSVPCLYIKEKKCHTQLFVHVSEKVFFSIFFEVIYFRSKHVNKYKILSFIT